jgi:sec1 family domain-containing protein 1
MASPYSSSTSVLAQAQPPPSLRQLQRRALLKALNLNAQEDSSESTDLTGLPEVGKGDPVWKFLVFDKLGQDVISSVLRVSDLREAGVTVHMQLKADRQQMEDVPASNFPPQPASHL